VHWQKDKNQKNIQKHEYSLDAAIHALNDPHAVRIMDDMAKEYRETTMCRGPDGNILFVVWSWLDTGEEISAIRIISVRKAEPFEESIYVNSMTPSSKNMIENRVLSEVDKELSPNVKVEAFGPWFKKMVRHRQHTSSTKKE
jgi:uncharacterized DUF497 family protein